MSRVPRAPHRPSERSPRRRARDGRSNCDDDDFILLRAKRCEENGQGVIILTNDHFRDWVDGTSTGHAWFDAAWRDGHMCKFGWDHQELQPASRFL